MPSIGKNSSVTRVDENNKKLFGIVVGMYTTTVNGHCKPQKVYSVLWDSYLCPVPHLKSEITQNIIGNYTYNVTHHDVHCTAAKQKIEKDAEIAIARLNDASVVREQCVRLMKQNLVSNEILIVSERGIRKKNEDRILKHRQLITNNRQTIEDPYFSTSDNKEKIEVVDERIQPVWHDSILTHHYFTNDSPVFSDNSTCSPFKYH
jgi:hypothetical protein